MFGLFVVTWLVTRHIAYVMVCWSVYTDARRVMGVGCYSGTADALQRPLTVRPYESKHYIRWQQLVDPFRNPAGTICMGEPIYTGFLVFLLVLQATMLMWFVFIVQVVVRVLRGNDADDIRSDDEEDEEIGEEEDEEADLTDEKGIPIEEEVGVEGLNFELIDRRGNPRRPVNSTSFSMPGHSDRKEILNRIGCEKQIN